MKNGSSKAFEAVDSALDNSGSDDEISFVINNIKRMFKERGNSDKGKKCKPKESKEYKEKVVCYGCKKPEHFMSEY